MCELMTNGVSSMAVFHGTIWTAGPAGKSGLSRADKKRLKAQREAEIAAAERARMAGPGAGAESASEYEQQLLAQPNNSYLWIKYMAFQLKLGGSGGRSIVVFPQVWECGLTWQ